MMQGAGGRLGGGLSFRPTGNIGSSRSLPGAGGPASFWQMGQTHAQGAIGAYSGQHPSQTTKTYGPPKSIGGGLQAGMGYAATGAMLGSVVPGIGTAVGAVGGAAVGVLSYLLS